MQTIKAGQLSKALLLTGVGISRMQVCAEEQVRDTPGGINLTIEITSPMPGVIRVRTSHHLGVKKSGPEFALAGRTMTESLMWYVSLRN